MRLTQEEFAKTLGVSARTVSNWERGQTSPDPRHLPPGLDFPTDFRGLARDDFPNLFPVVRYRLGLTQAEFAARLGVSKDAVSDWERGRHKPRCKTRRELEQLMEETLTEEERLAIEIRSFRVRLGLTQEDLAARLGVGDSSVSRWERAERKPNKEMLGRIRTISR